MPNENTNASSQPYMVIGAGNLVSHVHRIARNSEELDYQFNLFRVTNRSEVTHSFRPEDLRDVVKACQVLAFSIADDGWLSNDLRLELNDLAAELDVVTQKWSQDDE